MAQKVYKSICKRKNRSPNILKFKTLLRCATNTQLERLEAMGTSYGLPVPEAVNSSLANAITAEAELHGGISRRSVAIGRVKHKIRNF